MQTRNPKTLFAVLFSILLGFTTQPDGMAADATSHTWANDLARAVCRTTGAEQISGILRSSGLSISDMDIRIDTQRQLVVSFGLDDGRSLDVQKRPGGSNRLIVSGGELRPRTDLMIQTGANCALTAVRIVTFDDDGHPVELASFDGDPPETVAVEALNPSVPSGTDPGGVAVAIVDTGINYILPGVAKRLARTTSGEILGYDFHKDDRQPFDLDPSRPAYFPIRHGTAVASIILREAPAARLIPIRYAARKPERFADIVNHIAAGPARIVAMSLGGSQRADWAALEAAIARNRDILFVVSAGNNGRDIDGTPIYPASFDANNILTVTSTDAFGKLALESNWGQTSVDIAVPGERIEVTDHRGARARASGTSYAVPRVAALAARISARNPGWDAARIKTAIVALTAPLATPARQVRHGWIPNPAIE